MIKKNKTYIIAEIGINFEGSLTKAKNLIKLAHKAGADAVKFQLFQPNTLASIAPNEKNKQKILLNKLWNKVYLSFEDLKFLYNFSKKLKIDFFCSVFDLKSLDILKKLNLQTVKVASSDINDHFLLKQLSKSFKNIIVSTGMSNFDEIKSLKKIFSKNNLYILHCVSSYPVSKERVNLNRMVELSKKFQNVGYSDHYPGTLASKLAISLGSKVLEKHFTFDNKRKGFDHSISANFSELKEICNYRDEVPIFLGSGEIHPHVKELKNKKLFRKGVYYKKNIIANQKVIINDIEIRRPQNNFDLNDLNKILNKPVKKNVFSGKSVHLKDFFE